MGQQAISSTSQLWWDMKEKPVADPTHLVSISRAAQPMVLSSIRSCLDLITDSKVEAPHSALLSSDLLSSVKGSPTPKRSSPALFLMAGMEYSLRRQAPTDRILTMGTELSTVDWVWSC